MHAAPATETPHVAAASGSAADEARRTLAAAVAQARRELTATSADAQRLLDRLAGGPPESLRQIPAAAQAMMSAAQNPDLSRNHLVSLVEGDPAVAQALLGTANSAAFTRGGAAVASLGQAVDRLGTTATRAVVLTQALKGLISRPGGDLDRMAALVWQHMTDVGSLARQLSPVFAAESDEAFSAGLLHDVGKLVFFDACSAFRAEHRRGVIMDPDALRYLLRVLHEPLGELAALEWGMPSHVARAIGTHHRDPTTYSLARSPSFPLAETVFLAERAALARRSGGAMPVKQWWEEGRLTGSAGLASDLIDRLAPLA